MSGHQDPEAHGITLTPMFRGVLANVLLFCEVASSLTLRPYQAEAAEAIIESIFNRRGLTFVIMFPRQSGKNELQAQLQAYLLTLYGPLDAEMVAISPTYKPQTINAMRRLERVLERNMLTIRRWKKESGYMFRVDSARIAFLSGDPKANVVGHTANLLLSCDEAQDVTIEKWDKDFAPMAASTNATKVFWGTAWTSRTLLARELRAARLAEQQDGIRRVFICTAEDVARVVPAYAKHVANQVARLGRNHPLIKTQYFSEEIDAEGGMFSPARVALMKGNHARQDQPQPGKLYACLLDIAGQDEAAIDDEAVTAGALRNPGRDSTALTVVEVDLSSLEDELIKAPAYRVVNRYEWVGTKHTSLYGQIKALVQHWETRYLVVDATGVGEGLWSFLDKALPNVVLPFKFTPKSKSELGWGFLAIIETGRYKEYIHHEDKLQQTFWTQVENCQYMVIEGPNKIMRWGVPDGSRDAATGEQLHDDLLISAAMVHVLDAQPWGLAESTIIEAEDPLANLSEVF